MRLAIIIVNYRTSQLVCNCLQSLKAQTDGSTSQVIIVDNNSRDGSIDRISETINKEQWNDWVTLLPQRSNLGFASGNNAGIKGIQSFANKPNYYLLLNPDTIVPSGALDKLITFLDAYPEVGIVGAQLENEERVPQSSGRRFPSIWSEFETGTRLRLLSRLLQNKRVALPVPKQPHRCDWVSGAAMLVRSSVFEQVGLLDEGFFLYFEELDFCHRAHDAGWQIWIEPTARVIHLEGQATGIQLPRKRRGHYWYASRMRYFIKHHGILKWLTADLLWGIGRISLLVRHFFSLGGDLSRDPLYFCRDLLLGDLFALVSGSAFKIKKEQSIFLQDR